MIYRISGGLAIISAAKAFLTHGTGMVRIKAIYSITQPYLSRSDGWNFQEDEVKGLKDEIAKHERELLTVVDSRERAAIINQITACRDDITAIRQQGLARCKVKNSCK
jgi:hypothetical protein